MKSISYFFISFIATGVLYDQPLTTWQDHDTSWLIMIYIMPKQIDVKSIFLVQLNMDPFINKLPYTNHWLLKQLPFNCNFHGKECIFHVKLVVWTDLADNSVYITQYWT